MTIDARPARFIVVALGAIVLVAGCAAPAQLAIDLPITGSNNRIEMPHYSIVVPAEAGWRKSAAPAPADAARQFEMLYLTQKSGNTMRILWVMRNSILSPAMQRATAKEVADDYRQREAESMVENGVRRHRYQLSGIENGTQIIGGKTFFTMDYLTRGNAEGAGKEVAQKTTLFVYLAAERGNQHLMSIVFTEGVVTDASRPGAVPDQDESQRHQVIQALATLAVH